MPLDGASVWVLTVPIRSDRIVVDRVGTINDRLRTLQHSLSLGVVTRPSSEER